MSTNAEPGKAKGSQNSKSDISHTISQGISIASEEFEIRALENGILGSVKSGEHPAVDANIHKRLLARRGSPSPTQSHYNKFADRIDEASNNQGIMAVYSKYVLQDAEDAYFDTGYRRKEDEVWTEFPQNVGFNNGLPAPEPGMIEGFSRDSFPKTIEHIKACRLVGDEHRYVALPHLAVEYQACETSMHKAKVKAGYYGAAMVYGRNEALRFIGKPDPPRQPVVLTATIVGEEWAVYGHFARIDDASGREEYCQCHMDGGRMESLEEYERGRKVLRNMQDFAREQSSALRDSMAKDYDEYGSCQSS